jgi:hypothetical protein
MNKPVPTTLKSSTIRNLGSKLCSIPIGDLSDDALAYSGPKKSHISRRSLQGRKSSSSTFSGDSDASSS